MTTKAGDVNALTGLISRAKRVLCFTGAGISTASRIPDFRGPQGVWQTRSPVDYQQFIDSEASRIEYWDFKLEGYPAFRDAKPNPAHYAIAELERLGKLALLVTQNIDGLHLASGVSAEKLVELHGTGAECTCIGCHRREPMTDCLQRFSVDRTPPRCAACGELVKPAVVMFGEGVNTDDLRRAWETASSADLVISLGSSLVVTPAADIPLHAARCGTPYVIINQGVTAHDELATLRIDADVSTVLPLAMMSVK